MGRKSVVDFIAEGRKETFLKLSSQTTNKRLLTLGTGHTFMPIFPCTLSEKNSRRRTRRKHSQQEFLAEVERYSVIIVEEDSRRADTSQQETKSATTLVQWKSKC